MNLNEYQKAAARTIACDGYNTTIDHALFGLCAESAECLEVWSRYWRSIADKEVAALDMHLVKEFGDVYWMIAEFCTANKWDLADVAAMDPTEDTVEVFNGMLINIGELLGMYQKLLQGHFYTADDAKEHIRNILFCLDACIRNVGHTPEEVMETNIRKLEDRYPDGFSVERSTNRADGDI